MIEISDIKGISIFHKTLGEGRVVDLKKDLLYIQFGDQVKGFKLPLALEGIQAPLKSDNILINDLVNQIKIQNSTCCLCGKIAPQIKEYKEQRLCNDCYTTANKCKICGRRVTGELVSFVEAELCDDCFLERYFKCDVCGEYNTKWDEAESNIIPKGEHWCRYCIDTCCVCEREIKLDKTTIYNLNYYSYHMLYVCANYPECDTYVRVQKGTNKPLGTLANKRLRELRNEAHKSFDKLHKRGYITRRSAYDWLAGLFCISLKRAHIAQFSEPQCLYVIEQSKKYLEILEKRYKDRKKRGAA